MHKEKKYVLRDVRTHQYLSVFDEMLDEVRSFECIVTLEPKDDRHYLQHEGTGKVLLNDGKWGEIGNSSPLLFDINYNAKLYADCLIPYSESNYRIDDKEDLPPRYILEENDDTPVDVTMLGDFCALKKEELDEINAMQSGGNNLQISLDRDKKSDELMANLINYIGTSEEGAPIWRSGYLSDRKTTILYCYIEPGTIITIACKDEVNEHTRKFVRNTFEKGDQTDWSTQSVGVITYKTPFRTSFSSFIFSTNGVELIARTVFCRMVAAAISNGLSYIARSVAKKLVTRTVDAAFARGLQSSMSQGGAYVRLVSYMGSASTGAALIGGALNIGIFILVHYLLSRYLFPAVFKKQYLSLQVFNMTEKSVALSIAYMDNVPTNSQENPKGTYYTLPPYIKNPTDPFLESLGITPNDTVVYNCLFKFENNWTLFDGFGVLLGLSLGENSKKEILACYNIPYSHDNSNIISLLKSGEDYSDAYSRLNGKNRKLSYSIPVHEGEIHANSSITALNGHDNFYKGQVVLTNDMLKSNK